MAIQSVVSVNPNQAYAPPNNGGGEVAAEVRVLGASQTGAAAPTAQPQQATSAQQPASAQQVRDAADNINKALQSLTSSNLQFSVDHDTGETVVRVVDVKTKEVIRQIPNEEALTIAKSIDKLQGLLIRQKA